MSPSLENNKNFERKIRTNPETEKPQDEMGKNSEEQISDPSTDKNLMEQNAKA
jgi:hypothetical protein